MLWFSLNQFKLERMAIFCIVFHDFNPDCVFLYNMTSLAQEKLVKT
jgi:hypothetical protein